MKRQHSFDFLLRFLAVALISVFLLAASGCGTGEDSGPALLELTLAEAPSGARVPTATGYYGAPLSEFEVDGVAIEAESGKAVPGSWSFAEDQALVVPEKGTAYTAVFTPETGAENYTVLTAEIVPEILDSAPVYRKLTASDVHSLIAGEILLDDLELSQGTIYPSGTMYWLDNTGQVLDGSAPVEKDAIYIWRFVADGADGLIGVEAGWTMEGRVTLWPSFIEGTADETHGGITYRLYVPDSYTPGEEVPVYMYLHGCGASISSALSYTGLDDLAEEENFLVLMPQQSRENNKKQCWNWFKTFPNTAGNVARLGGEPENLVAILNSVCADFSVDKDKLFVGGLSAGGYMANILAATYPDVFSGVMVNAGGAYLVDRTYNEASRQMDAGAESATGQTIRELADEVYVQMGEYARVVPMVVVQGLSDTTVYPQNGLDAAQCWAEVLHRIDGNISTEPVVTAGEANGGTYTLYTYYNEADGTAVVKLYMVDGLDHMYATPMVKAPDAVKVSYEFFISG